jgi:hypothetical protein
MLLCRRTYIDIPYGTESSPSSSHATDGSLAFGSSDAPGWAERSKSASNPMIAIEDLSDFAHDPHYFVRVAVAKNQSTPQELLGALAADPNRLVRGSVAFNPNVSLDLLAALKQDSDPWVRQTARENLKHALARSSEEAQDIAA